MRPTSVKPSRERILKLTSRRQMENRHTGPSIRSTTSPAPFLMLNRGVSTDHSCSMEPIRSPGGENTFSV
ncbi:hypothetical protein WDU94_004836 [Cyamophila willieti]